MRSPRWFGHLCKATVYLLTLALIAGLWLLYPLRPRLTLPLTSCRAASVSADGRTLATACDDGLALWDLSSGALRQAEPISWANVSMKLHLSSDATQVVIVERPSVVVQDRVSIWLPSRFGKPMPLYSADEVVHGPERPPTSDEVLHVSDRFLVTLEYFTGITIRSLPTGKRLHVFSGDGIGPGSYLGSDGRWLVLRTDPYAVVIWDMVENGPLLRIHPEPFDEPLGWSPVLLGGPIKRLATIKGPKVAIWDLVTAQEVNAITLETRDWGVEREVTPHLFSSDGTRLLTALDNCERWDCWDLTTRPPRKLGSLDGSFYHQHYAFSPDSKWLPDYHNSQGLILLSAADLRPCTVLAQTFNPYTVGGRDFLGFAPDSRTIVSSLPRPPGCLATRIDAWLGRKPDDRPMMRMWDTSSGRELLICPGCSNAIYSPDGTLLITWGTDGPVQVWDVPPHRPILIDYGLPTAFLAFLLLGWFRRRQRARVSEPAPV